jgi:hypothetical protein
MESPTIVQDVTRVLPKADVVERPNHAGNQLATRKRIYAIVADLGPSMQLS